MAEAKETTRQQGTERKIENGIETSQAPSGLIQWNLFFQEKSITNGSNQVNLTFELRTTEPESEIKMMITFVPLNGFLRCFRNSA